MRNIKAITNKDIYRSDGKVIKKGTQILIKDIIKNMCVFNMDGKIFLARKEDFKIMGSDDD